jgi:hypothetical protein
MSSAEVAQAAVLSDRDQYWLDHQSAQAASSQTAKEYAATEGLSLEAFYQARKRLRQLGLLAPRARAAKSPRKPRREKSVSFSKIAVAPHVPNDRFRLELPSGITFEWPGGDVPESVAGLLERLVFLT